MFTWEKLLDRCRLFEPGAPRPLLKQLLKEAEEELCKSISILERKMWYQGPFTSYQQTSQGDNTETAEKVNDYLVLPNDFLSVKWVFVDGVQINAIQQNEKHLDSENEKSEGMPRSYYVHNNRLYFDTIPEDNNVLIEYFAQLTTTTRDKEFLIRGVNSLIIDGDDDENIVPPTLESLSSKGDYKRSLEPTVPKIKKTDISDSAQLLPDENRDDLYYGFAIDCSLGENLIGETVLYNGTKSRIQAVGHIANDVGQFYFYDGNELTVGHSLTILNFREIGPIIPQQYQKELCYYALNIATNKDEYLKMWLGMLQGIQALDMDRDLIHTVKGVV